MNRLDLSLRPKKFYSEVDDLIEWYFIYDKNITNDILKQLRWRKSARENKAWEAVDMIKENLIRRKIDITDTSSGQRLKLLGEKHWIPLSLSYIEKLHHQDKKHTLWCWRLYKMKYWWKFGRRK